MPLDTKLKTCAPTHLYLPTKLLVFVLLILRPLLSWPLTGHFHWVGKIQEILVTGWAVAVTGWLIAHPVNMLAEALSQLRVLA